MADVRPPRVPGTGESRTGPRGRDRGQLFLVGALALSVILVTLAVLLNTAIYTGNVATRDPGTGSSDVIEYRNDVGEMATRTITAVNYRNNTTYAALEANFSESVDAWSVTATQHSAVTGSDAYTETASTTQGTRIVQEGDRDFSNAGGTADWTLVTDVQVRNFSVTVNESTLPVIDPDDDATYFGSTFHVDVTNSNGDVWQVYIYSESGTGDVKVAVIDPTGSLDGQCTTTTPDPTVDFTNASLAGSYCEALDFWNGADAPYDVEYRDGDTANGNYSLIVDEDYSTLEGRTAYNDDDAGASPYVTPALYSAEVKVTYRSPSVYYQRHVRVAPGEYDA